MFCVFLPAFQGSGLSLGAEPSEPTLEKGGVAIPMLLATSSLKAVSAPATRSFVSLIGVFK